MLKILKLEELERASHKISDAMTSSCPLRSDLWPLEECSIPNVLENKGRDRVVQIYHR